VLLGIVMVVALSWLTLHSNLLHSRYITASMLPSGAVFMLVVVMMANVPLRRYAPRHALTRAELAILFSMLYITAALPQASVGQTLWRCSAGGWPPGSTSGTRTPSASSTTASPPAGGGSRGRSGSRRCWAGASSSCSS
jgi:hypothetical protein